MTDNLEVGGFAPALHVVNVAGRQRILSQRLAKAAILAALLSGPAAAAACATAATAEAELDAGLGYLRGLPLTNPTISADLDQVSREWEDYRRALSAYGQAEGQARVAELSETLLNRFDGLTTAFERAMQAFD